MHDEFTLWLVPDTAYSRARCMSNLRDVRNSNPEDPRTSGRVVLGFGNLAQMSMRRRLHQDNPEACAPVAWSAEFATPSPSELRGLRERMPEDWGFIASEWPEAWGKTYLPYQRWRGPYRCLTIRDRGGSVTGVLPLATMAFGPIKFTTLAGYYQPYRGIAVVADPLLMQSTCKKMVEVLAADLTFRAALRMGPISADDMNVAALLSTLCASGWRVGRRATGQTFTIDLPPLAEFTKACKGIIKKVTYYQRRLRTQANLIIKEFTSLDQESWVRVLADVEAVEKNSWVFKDRGLTKFSGANDRQFWLRVLSDAYLSSVIAIWIMYVDDKPVSFSLNLNVGRTKHIVANSHDDAFAVHSPGHIVAYHVLVNAIERGITCVDWGQGDDSGYKQRWLAKPSSIVHDVVALPPGLLARGLERVFRRARYEF